MVGTRFEQEDFKIYVNIQEILLKSFACGRCETMLKFGFIKRVDKKVELPP